MWRARSSSTAAWPVWRFWLWGVLLIGVYGADLVRVLPEFLDRAGRGTAAFLVALARPGSGGAIGRQFALHLASLALAAAVVTSVMGTGARLVRHLGLPSVSRLEECLFGLLLGWAILALALFCLGAAGLVSVPAAWLLLAGFAAAGSRYVRDAWRDARLVLRSQAQSALDPVTRVLLGLCGLGFLITFTGSLAPPWWVDELVYHLGVPKHWARLGAFIEMPGHIFSYFPMHQEMLYLEALLTGNAVTARLVNAFLGVAAVLAVYALGSRVTSRRGALFAAAVLASLPVFSFVSQVAAVETGVVLGVALAAVGLLEYASHRTTSALLLTGVACGTYAGVKYTGVPFALVCGVGLCLDAAREPRRGWRSVAMRLLGFGLPALIPVLPYLVRNTLCAGNPVYPFFFGGTGMEPGFSRAVHEYHRNFGFAHRPFGAVLAPWLASVAAAGDFGDLCSIGPVFLLLLPLACRPAAISRQARYLLAAAGVSYLLWLPGTPQMRFLLPTFVLLAPVLGATVAPDTAGPDPVRRLALGLSLAVLGLTTLVSAVHLASKNFLPAIVGLVDATTFSRQVHIENSGFAYINRETPPDSRVLLVNMGGMVYYLDRDFYTDTMVRDRLVHALLRSSADAEAVWSRLRQMRMTHVAVYANGVFCESGTPEVVYPEPERRVLNEFLNSRYAQIVYSNLPLDPEHPPDLRLLVIVAEVRDIPVP